MSELHHLLVNLRLRRPPNGHLHHDEFVRFQRTCDFQFSPRLGDRFCIGEYGERTIGSNEPPSELKGVIIGRYHDKEGKLILFAQPDHRGKTGILLARATNLQTLDKNIKILEQNKWVRA